VGQEDSGFLSQCYWPMDDESGAERVSMENFALIRVLGKGGWPKGKWENKMQHLGN
jgi:hypothetical protein